MTQPIILGIDPSISGTALAWGSTEAEVEIVRFSSKNLGKSPDLRIKRLELLMEQVKAQIAQIQPKVAVIEHYSFGSINGGEYLGEWGGLLRWHLLDFCPVYEIPPSSLKKFITGSGNAKKDAMVSFVSAHWRRAFTTNDHVDAFAVYQFALRMAGVVPPTNKEQRDAIAKVIGDRPFQLDAPAPF